MESYDQLFIGVAIAASLLPRAQVNLVNTQWPL